MMLSGVGTIWSYFYNTKTGVLSSKTETEEAFVDYYNDELQADETENLNGYDHRTKVAIKNILDIWQQFADASKLTALSEDTDYRKALTRYETSMEMAMYERIWSKGYCSKGKDMMDESTIFHTKENLRYQRKLQKKREERELKERREQKERMEEALEEYAQYRRELRHYYNELGYQRRLEGSDPTAVPVGCVKRPPVVSGVYEMIMMLGM